MAWKYESVIDNLTPLPFDLREGGGEYQLKVDVVKSTIEEKTPADLARRYRRLRSIEDKIEARAKKIRLQLRATEQLMEKAYQTARIRKLEFEEGGSVIYNPKPYANVRDKAAYHKWCIDNGYEAKMSLPWVTTNEIVGSRVLEGIDLPDGVDVYAKPAFSLHK